MNVEIYYFTGTGNSLMIARDIAKSLGVSEPVSMTKMAKREMRPRIDGDVVGFVFPVYFARPPVFIKEFVDRVIFSDDPYIFAVMNGGGLFGRALPLFDELLGKRGQSLDAGFIIPMPGNHPKIARLMRKDRETYYKCETERVRYAAGVIGARRPHRIETNWGLLGRLLSSYGFRKAYSLSLNKKLDSDFWVNTSCISCGTCEKLCPTDNIMLEDGNPVWHGNCINCAACYHHCPAKAICLGEEDKNFRYTHPGVSLQDMFVANE